MKATKSLLKQFRKQTLATREAKKRISRGWKPRFYSYVTAAGKLSHAVIDWAPRPGTKGKAFAESVIWDSRAVRFKSPDNPGTGAPLFGEHRLPKYPKAAVWVVQGERAAAALNRRFKKLNARKQHIAVAPGASSYSVRSADWRSLEKRTVLVWANAGADGESFRALFEAKVEDREDGVDYIHTGKLGLKDGEGCLEWLGRHRQANMKVLRSLPLSTSYLSPRYADWPDAQPLHRALLPSERFPLKALGPVLQPAAKAIARAVKAPDGLVAQCLLAASALATQAHANVTFDGRTIPLSLFFLTVAVSGERKSAVDRIALRPMEDHQNRLERGYRKEQAGFDVQQMLFKQKQQNVMRIKNEKARQRAIAKLGPAPRRPLSPLLKCDDVTIEGLLKHLLNGQPSVGLFSDEGGKFIGGYSMRKENGIATASALSTLWDARTVARLRANSEEGPIVLNGRRVALHQMMQPNVAQTVTSDRNLLEQGLLSRCLIAAPESMVGNRTYVQIDAEALPEVRRYYDQLEILFRLPPNLRKGTRNELLPRALPLTKRAQKKWIRFHDEIEKESGPGRRYEAIQGFAAKSGEHALRLAGVLTLVLKPKAAEVEKAAVVNAISLTKYYLQEASRLYGASTLDPDLHLAEKVLKTLQEKTDAPFPLSWLYQYGPGLSIRSATRARTIMKILCDHNWAIKTNRDAKPGQMEWYEVRKDLMV